MVYVRHPGVHVSTNLSDLKPNTCYTITICSSNTGGMSPNSNMVTACTDDDDYDYDDYDDEYDDESDEPSRSGSHTH